MSQLLFHARRILTLLLVTFAFFAGRSEAQLPSPARDAAEELLDLVRSGDEEHLRQFIETRFAPELRDFAPMEDHLSMFSFFRSDLEGRELTNVRLLGPHEVAMILQGAGNPLELRLVVDPEPPHRIVALRVSDAGPAWEANSTGELRGELERLSSAGEFAGIILAGDFGRVRFHEGYGLADRAARHPISSDTRFDIGSLGKLFTATAVLRLVQQSRINLSDPLGNYLGGFDPRVAANVTIEHLLTHRAGFGDYFDHPRFEAEPKRFREPADFIPLARVQELAFEPGADRRYSNMGYVLLGAILEKVHDRSYPEVIQDVVFRPAGMSNAGATGGPNAARRYHPMDNRLVAFDSAYPDVSTPAGGAFATATDLSRFLEALFDHRLLDEEHTAFLLNDFEEPVDGTTLPEQVAYSGGAPGVNAVLLARPSQRRSVVILANIDGIPLAPLARHVLALVSEQIPDD